MTQLMMAVVGVLAAIFFDWRRRKIPNALTFSMVILGFILNTVEQGLSGFEQSFLGFVIGILFLYFPFAWGGVGGGDVKLMGGLGSLLGPSLVFKIFLASAVFGGLLSLLAMFKTKTVTRTLRSVKDKALFFIMTKRFLSESEAGGERMSLQIPYAYAIGCGTLFVLFFLKGG